MKISVALMISVLSFGSFADLDIDVAGELLESCGGRLDNDGASIVVNLPTKIQFKNDDDLFNWGDDSISCLASLLLGDDKLKLLIVGHADQNGLSRRNYVLAKDRARNVKAALEGMGVDGGRVTAVSNGDGVPIDLNVSNYIANRRVELILSY